MSTEALAGFVHDGRALAGGPSVATVAAVTSRGSASPLVGAVAVRDDDLPAAAGLEAGLRCVLTAGAGQVAGPAAFCTRRGLELLALDVTLRDPGDPAGNARRVAAAVDAARTAGDLGGEVAVHVRPPEVPAAPTPGLSAMVDVLAESGMLLALPLGDGIDVAAWVDAALDREVATSLVGGDAEDAAAALRTTARLWGDEADLLAARRWCRCWLAEGDVEVALADLTASADP